MAETTEGIQLEVITPEKLVFSGKVDDVVFPGIEGEFGVLRGHVPFLSGLGSGVMSYSLDDGKRVFYAVGQGYVEVTGSRAIVLTEMAKPAEQIDTAQVQKNKESAEQKLAKLSTDDPEFEEVKKALREAEVMLSIVNRQQ